MCTDTTEEDKASSSDFFPHISEIEGGILTFFFSESQKGVFGGKKLEIQGENSEFFWLYTQNFGIYVIILAFFLNSDWRLGILGSQDRISESQF